jgi:nucleoside-diphosphate-sugar epimerase
MNTVLVTGAGGYIGSTLIQLLIEAGYRVVGLDRYFFGKELLGDILEAENFTSVVKDIRDIEPDDFAGVDAVCDLAALSNDPSGDLDPALTFSINHVGRVHVANMAKTAGVRRYILASSCSVYGHGDDGQLDENSQPRPLTTYAKANLAAEQEILPLATPDFCVTVLRQASVFGLSKRMRFDLVINLMTLNAVEKGRLFITGGGRQWRPIVHVSDTSRAFIRVLEADSAKVNGEIFNVAASNMQVLGIAYTVREAIPFPIEMQIVPDDPDKRNYNVSFDKIARVLDYSARVTVADGVSEIYEALKLGRIAAEPWTYTTGWYKRLLEAKALLDRLMINGRLL